MLIHRRFFQQTLLFLPISRSLGQGAKRGGVRAPSFHFTGFGRSEKTTQVATLVSLILTLDFLFVGPSCASSQTINGCAAQHSGQLLAFGGKTCSLGRAFTKSRTATGTDGCPSSIAMPLFQRTKHSSLPGRVEGKIGSRFLLGLQ